MQLNNHDELRQPPLSRLLLAQGYLSPGLALRPFFLWYSPGATYEFFQLRDSDH